MTSDLSLVETLLMFLFRVITKMFGNFWSNVVILVNFWSFNPLHVSDRLERRVTQKKYAKELTSIFENKFDLPRGSLPIVFIDSHYNRSIPEGKILDN